MSEQLTPEQKEAIIRKQRLLTKLSLIVLPFGVGISMWWAWQLWQHDVSYGIFRWWVPLVNGLLLTAAWVQVSRYRTKLMELT